MSYNLGTAEGTIALNYNGKGADKAKKDVDELGKRGARADETFGKIGRTTGVAGAAIAAGIGLAVNAAANFEQRMSAVQAVSGASQKEMDQLSKKALQLGKDTSFSATEAAQAIEELVKAGVSVPDVMNGAADATVALAAAGEISLPEAATIAANAMNQFNLSAQQMPRIADLIAGAANASAIDVGDFGQSLSQVGAVANLVGASFDDTAAAIALMGNAGIKGSDAGTSLKTMLTNLQPQTKKQADLMKELGIITEDGKNIFFDANGKLGDMADVAGILNRALKGMTAAQKQATLTTLFGSDAVRAAAVFANEGAVGFNKMAQSMTKVTAADVAKTRLDNFKGSLEQLKGSLETASIVIGQILLPALRSIVDAVTSVLNKFLNLSTNTQELILAIVGIVGAALLVTAAFLKIILTIQKVVEILKVLRLAMATTWVAALGPIGLIIIAIAAVVAIIIVLWKKSETFRDIVMGVWNAIKTAISVVVTFITGTVVPALVAAWNAIVSSLQAVGAFFAAVWNGFVAVITFVVNIIKTIIMTYFNIYKTIILAALDVIMGIWRTFWGIFGGIITAAFNLIVQIIRLGVAVWALIINTATKAILAVIRAVWNAIVAETRAKVNLVKSVVTTVWNFLKAVTSTVWNAIRAVTVAVWNAIKSAVIVAINAVKGPVSSAVNTVKAVISSVWNAIKAVTSSVWNALSPIVSGALNRVYSVVSSIVGRIRGIFAGAASWLYNAGRNIIQGLLNGIESLINAVTSKLKALTDKIPKVKGPEQRDKKLLQPAGKWIMEGFIKELDKGIIAALNHLSGATDMIPDTITAKQVQTVMPATGLSAASSLVPVASPEIPPAAGPTINLTTYNPVGKPAVEELSEQATRLASLGVL